MSYLEARGFAPVVHRYLTAVAQACASPSSGVVSVVLFGSAATGSYLPETSDVDLLIVVADTAMQRDKHRIRDMIADIEARSGVMKPCTYRRGAIDALADRITANVRSFFVCTRAELVSGEPAGILGIPAIQAWFVDRVPIPNMIASGVTVWGEDLLSEVRLPPIRALDVVKAFFSCFSVAWCALLSYPVIDGATKYSMEALKRSVHNCYYCYHREAARLSRKTDFFQRRIRKSAILSELMNLRSAYRPSFWFVVRCLAMLIRLHAVTVRDNQFPKDARPIRPSLRAPS